MRIALIVDSSSAIASLLNNLRAGLTTFLNELPGEREMAFIRHGGQMRIRQARTANRQKLKTADQPAGLGRRREFADRDNNGNRAPFPERRCRVSGQFSSW